MNIRYRLLSMTMCGLLLLGCKDTNDPPKTPPKPQGTVFDGVISQKDRAQKGIDDAMEKNKAKLEESMKRNERSDSAE